MFKIFVCWSVFLLQVIQCQDIAFPVNTQEDDGFRIKPIYYRLKTSTYSPTTTVLVDEIPLFKSMGDNYPSVWSCSGLRRQEIRKIITWNARPGLKHPPDPRARIKYFRRTTERPKPVVNQEKCPGNQLYYYGEPWFCDCGPRYIYYKPTDQCYRAYMKGPCSEGQHLIVKNRIVHCVRNPCPEGHVRYNGKCFELEKSDGPCEKINGNAALLKINPDTLVVECTEAAASTLTLFNFPERCPPGSKRDASNKCRENWNVD